MHRHLARAAVGVTMGLLAAAFPHAPATAQEERTFRGEIVDPASYLKDGRHGPSFVDQTYEALDGGQTLALLEDTTGTLYLLLAEEPGEDPNELVYDYVNQSLTVQGTVYERGGLHGIVLHSIEPIEPAEPTGAASPPPDLAAPQ